MSYNYCIQKKWIYNRSQEILSGGKNMDVFYVKTLLFAYAGLDDVILSIDEQVGRKAINSRTNYSPAISQFEEIIALTNEKEIILAVKLVCDTVLGKFSEEDLTLFRYKYFGTLDEMEELLLDTTSRTYFRRQERLFNRFARRVENLGIDDDFFVKKCLSVDFFKQIYEELTCLDQTESEEIK